MDRRSTLLSFMMVLLCVPISGVGVDLYAPSLPSISRVFNANDHLVQLTITSYMLGFGFSQFLLAPMSDAFGRKPLIIVGASGYVLTLVGMLLASSIEQIIFWRLIQGISVSFISVPARAINADIFSGDEFIRKTKTMVLAWGLGPILSPAVGGYLQSFFGWRANFWFMFIYGMIILMMAIFVFKESHEERYKLSIRRFGDVYGQLATHKFFMHIAISCGLLYTFIILFHLKAPFVLAHYLGHTPVEYGYIALMMGAGFLLGSLLSKQSHRFPILKNISVLLSITLAFVLILVFFTALLAPNKWILAAPIIACVVVVGLCFSDLLGRALAFFPNIAGGANGVFFSSVWTVSAIASGLASTVPMVRPLGLALGYLVLSVITYVYYLMFLRKL